MMLVQIALIVLLLIVGSPSLADCPHSKLNVFKPSQGELVEMLKTHKQWLENIDAGGRDLGSMFNFRVAKGEGNVSGRATLCNADLRGLDLRNLDFSGVDLTGADMSFLDLRGSTFFMTGLDQACLHRTNLAGVDLEDADLSNTRLDGADLSGANLTDAKLNGAYLFQTKVAEANLSGADLSGSFYAPLGKPPSSDSVDLRGLSSSTYRLDFMRYHGTDTCTGVSTSYAGSPSGLTQLRKVLGDAGLRQNERELTYALEHTLTLDYLPSWRYSSQYPWPENWLRSLGGVARLVLFDWTTGWGLYPHRALFIIVALWVFCTPIYAWSVWASPASLLVESGIYTVWPKEYVGLSRHGRVKSGRLKTHGWSAIGWGAYFSLLSTFHIGYREFSVGNWIGKMQRESYALEPTGWVRSLSGIQSLLCLYLFAMWLLTQYGRPFQ